MAQEFKADMCVAAFYTQTKKCMMALKGIMDGVIPVRQHLSPKKALGLLFETSQ